MSNSSFNSALSHPKDSTTKEVSSKSPASANPFDYLYNSTDPSPKKLSIPSNIDDETSIQHDSHHDQIYSEIQNRVSSPAKSSFDIMSTNKVKDEIEPFVEPLPPVITIIETSTIKRSGSVISESASIRNRNKIKNRTKMAKKSEIEDKLNVNPQSNTKSKPNHTKKSSIFQFSVKRSISLKRKPSEQYAPLGQSVPNFKSEKDLDKFIEYCISSSPLMVELLPKFMKFFEFKHLIMKRRPDLVYTTQMVKHTDLAKAQAQLYPPSKIVRGKSMKRSNLVHSSQKKSLKRKAKPKGVSFLRKSNTKVKKVTISSPIKESFTHSGFNPYFTTTAAAAVAEAALGNSPVNPLVYHSRSKSKSKDLPIALDIISRSDDGGSIPMTLDPITKLFGGTTSEGGAVTQLSPGVIAAVIAAAEISSLESTSPYMTDSLPSSPPSISSDPYINFRNALFNSKTKRPISYGKLFPQAGNIPPNVSRKEVQQMNRTLFLEVLLRRTIAAKVGYRLNMNDDKRVSSNELDSTDSSFEDSNGKARRKRYHFGADDLPRFSSSDDSDSDHDSVSTNDLINEKSLVSSEILPSPQISYSTDFFGNLHSEEFRHYDHFLQSDDVIKKLSPVPLQPQAAIHTPPTAIKRRVDYSGKESTAKEIVSAIVASTISTQVAPVSTASIAHIPAPFMDSPFEVYEVKPVEDMFINDFNKKYYAQYGPKPDYRENQNIYQLQPLNRSEGTLSSSSASSSPLEGNSSSNDVNSHSNTQNSSTLHSNTQTVVSIDSSREKRNSKKSISSVNSGVINDLDEIASKISEFIQQEFDFPAPQFENPQQVQPLVFQEQLTPQTFHLFNDISPQAMYAYKAGVLSSEIVNHPSNSRQVKHTINRNDIKSMQGSILVAGPQSEASKSEKDDEFAYGSSYSFPCASSKLQSPLAS